MNCEQARYICSYPDQDFAHSRNLLFDQSQSALYRPTQTQPDLNQFIDFGQYSNTPMLSIYQANGNMKMTKAQQDTQNLDLSMNHDFNLTLEEPMHQKPIDMPFANQTTETLHDSLSFTNKFMSTPNITSQFKYIGYTQSLSPLLTETPLESLTRLTPNPKSGSNLYEDCEKIKLLATPSTAASTTSSSLPKLKPMKLQFYRTKMCPWVIASGHCRKDATCRYAHSIEDLRPLPDLSKTKLCDDLLKNGQCLNPMTCNYAHSYDELRATQSFVKTKLCPAWLNRTCAAGSMCRFAHGEEELRSDAKHSATLAKSMGKKVSPLLTCTPTFAPGQRVSEVMPLQLQNSQTRTPFYSTAGESIMQFKPNNDSQNFHSFPSQSSNTFCPSFQISSPTSCLLQSPTRSPPQVAYLPTQTWHSTNQNLSPSVDEAWKLQMYPFNPREYAATPATSYCIDPNLLITHLLPSGIFTPMTRRAADTKTTSSKTTVPTTLLALSATHSSSSSSYSSTPSIDPKKKATNDDMNSLSTPKIVMNCPTSPGEKSPSSPALPPPLSFPTEITQQLTGSEMFCYATPIPVYAPPSPSSPTTQFFISQTPHHQDMLPTFSGVTSSNANSYNLAFPTQTNGSENMMTSTPYFQRHFASLKEQPLVTSLTTSTQKMNDTLESVNRVFQLPTTTTNQLSYGTHL